MPRRKTERGRSGPPLLFRSADVVTEFAVLRPFLRESSALNPVRTVRHDCCCLKTAARMHSVATTILFLTLTALSSAAAFAKDRPHRHRRPATQLSLRMPTHQGAGSPHPSARLLDGQTLGWHGRVAEQQRLGSPLAVTSAAVHALRRGVFTGAMRVYGNQNARSGGLSWAAGGLPFSSLPTASSLNPYYRPVADRLPCDPAPVYRLTVFSLRF